MEIYYKNAEHILRVKPFSQITNITENATSQLNDVAIHFTKREIGSKSLHIIHLIKYDVDGIWVDRINQSKKFGNDSSSLDSFITRYGDIVGKRLFDEKLKKSVTNEATYIKKYGKTIGKQKYYELCKSKGSFSENHYIEKYGNIIGKSRWKATLDTKLKTQKENFKNKKWKNGRTLLEYQQRYGVDDGYIRWDNRNKRHSYASSLQRYIDEFGNDIGREVCRYIKDNSSLEFYTKKYGDIDGKVKYDIKRKKCGITLSKMIEKYGKNDGEIRYKRWLDSVTNGRNNIGVSNSSQELFWSVYEKLNTDLKNAVYFHELNEEYKIYQHLPNTIKLYKIDFKLNKKIIEFDCDYWHDVDNDKIRDAYLVSKLYKILRVRYEDYIKNKEEIINKCINFINETT
jgi:very-short-patch-repair endonuclease